MIDDILNTVSDVLSAPRKALWSVAPGLHNSDTGDVYSGSQVAQNAFGVDPESFWGKALGFGLEAAGDPLPILGGLATRAIGAGAKAAGGAASALRGTEEVAPLLNARRGVGMVKGFAPGYENKALGNALGLSEAPDFAGRLVGSTPAGLGEDMTNRMLNHGADSFATSPNLAGLFLTSKKSNLGMGLLPEGASPLTVRHETMHGLINRAANMGEYGGLGPVANVAARTQRLGQRTGNSFVQGLGGIADEVAAHGAEAKGVIPQTQKMLQFLANPTTPYTEQFSRTSPAAAWLYANRMPHNAAYGTLGALGGSGAGAGVGLAAPYMDGLFPAEPMPRGIEQNPLFAGRAGAFPAM